MPDAVLDALTAVRLRHPPDLPPGFHHHQVTMPAAHGVDAHAVAVQLVADGPDGPGAPDPDVLTAAAVRHWAGEDHGQLDVVRTSADALRAAGVPVLTLEDLGLVDPAVLATPGCPLVRVDGSTPLTWVRATRIGPPGHGIDGRGTDGAATGRVPYGQVVVRYLDGRPDEPVAHPLTMAGLGAGPTPDAAVAAAWADVVAQDAAWTWWSDTAAPAPRPLAPVPDLVRAWGRSPLRLDLRALPAPLLAGGAEGAVLAVVDDGAVTVLAVAAGPRAQHAAAARALWQLVVARDLADPGGSLVRSGAAVHRPSGDHLAAAGPGARGLVDPLHHVQLALDPTVRRRVHARLGGLRTTAPARGTQRSSSPGADPAPGAHGALAAVHGALAADPAAVPWVVDLTTPDVAARGWACVRVLVPGASRLAPGAFPPDPAVARAAARRLGREPGPRESVPWPGW
ncbi:YcaO-like family protein [Cellulomonas phragmiteti]|uniref:YcaO domain-containing protein n=1 Tax=Cellulomonas phragmiteti TaxID=478780 RepID=A0ABQ4DP80_9CELL|nr:YcaO-like family protein [Cellulomonas phragmiteti]GIG41165.1 hypothetical protein Cph01nite_29270 [Cellulomonas phragmiteti]